MPPENENPGECATCAGQSSNKIASRDNTIPNMIAYKPRGERGPTVYRDSTGISPEHMAMMNPARQPALVTDESRSESVETQFSSFPATNPLPPAHVKWADDNSDGDALWISAPPTAFMLGTFGDGILLPVVPVSPLPSMQGMNAEPHRFGLVDELDDNSIPPPTADGRENLLRCGTVTKFRTTTLVKFDQEIPLGKIVVSSDAGRKRAAGMIAQAVAKATEAGTSDTPSKEMKEAFSSLFEKGLQLDYLRLAASMCASAPNDICEQPPPCTKLCFPIAWEVAWATEGKVRQEITDYTPPGTTIHRAWVEWTIEVHGVFLLVCFPRVAVKIPRPWRR